MSASGSTCRNAPAGRLDGRHAVGGEQPVLGAVWSGPSGSSSVKANSVIVRERYSEAAKNSEPQAGEVDVVERSRRRRTGRRARSPPASHGPSSIRVGQRVDDLEPRRRRRRGRGARRRARPWCRRRRRRRYSAPPRVGRAARPSGKRQRVLVAAPVAVLGAAPPAASASAVVVARRRGRRRHARRRRAARTPSSGAAPMAAPRAATSSERSGPAATTSIHGPGSSATATASGEPPVIARAVPSVAMARDGFRIEHDTMGEVRVPAAARWGAQTQRAVENFPISGRPVEPRRRRTPWLASRGRWPPRTPSAAGSPDGVAAAIRDGRRRGRRRAHGTTSSRSTCSRPARARRRT